jgi:hypothetical protein
MYILEKGAPAFYADKDTVCYVLHCAASTATFKTGSMYNVKRKKRHKEIKKYLNYETNKLLFSAFKSLYWFLRK